MTTAKGATERIRELPNAAPDEDAGVAALEGCLSRLR